MKTCIVGAGVIGTIYGWALAEAGVDVTHWVRPGRRAALKDGVKLDVLDERKGHVPNNLAHYALKCVESISPTDGYELVILPVNANQLGAALETLAPLAGKAIFLPFTLNWEGLKVLDDYLPRDRYLLGYADGGGTIRDGVYWPNLGAEVHLGDPNGNESENLQRVKALFERADMKPDVQTNMLHWLWVHNASVVGFAAGFARDKDYRKTLKDGELMKTCLQATRELLALCEKRGVNLHDFPEVSYMNWNSWLILAMMRWMYATNQSIQRYTAHAASLGSLRETRLHYLAMLRSADELGVEMPALKSLGQYLENIQ